MYSFIDHMGQRSGDFRTFQHIHAGNHVVSVQAGEFFNGLLTFASQPRYGNNVEMPAEAYTHFECAVWSAEAPNDYVHPQRDIRFADKLWAQYFTDCPNFDHNTCLGFHMPAEMVQQMVYDLCDAGITEA